MIRVLAEIYDPGTCGQMLFCRFASVRRHRKKKRIAKIIKIRIMTIKMIKTATKVL